MITNTQFQILSIPPPNPLNSRSVIINRFYVTGASCLGPCGGGRLLGDTDLEER